MKRHTPRSTTPSTSMAAAATAFALALLAACSSGTATGTGTSGGTTLTIQGDAGNPTLVENFNPLSPNQLRGTYLVYEPLEIPSPVDGTYTPFLATGFRFTTPTTLVYTIRQNVTWSDGAPFGVDDVVFTFDLLKRYPALDSKGLWQQITGVTATGQEVAVTFKAPNVPFAGSVAQTPIVPKHLWAQVTDPVTYPNTHPVGTGPFTLDTFAPTEYALKRNPGYWQAGRIAPSTVAFPAQASNQSTNQLDVTSGRFDWAYNFIPDVTRTYVARDSAHNTYWFPPGGTIGLYLNLTKAPYRDANVRRGISLALDRHTIAAKAVNGYLDQASQSGLILPNLKKWLDPGLPNQGLVTQDLTAARAALGAAGLHDQGGKLVGADGKQVTMSIVVPAGFSDWIAAAKEVTNQLAALGIAVTLDLPQYAQYAHAIQSGTFDAAIGGFGGSGDPYTDFNNALNSGFAAPVNTATANNFERFKDPAVDRALAAMASATDATAARQAAYVLEHVMYDTVPVVLMYYGGSWGLFSTKHFTGWPSAANPYTLPTTYNNSLLTVLTHLTKA